MRTCRLCKSVDYSRPLFRYSVRHYSHAECGLKRFGDEFLRMIPRHEIGRIPYRELVPFASAWKLAEQLMREPQQ